MKTLLILWFV